MSPCCDSATLPKSSSITLAIVACSGSTVGTALPQTVCERVNVDWPPQVVLPAGLLQRLNVPGVSPSRAGGQCGRIPGVALDYQANSRCIDLQRDTSFPCMFGHLSREFESLHRSLDRRLVRDAIVTSDLTGCELHRKGLDNLLHGMHEEIRLRAVRHGVPVPVLQLRLGEAVQ